jgi:CheY-like chemotaxis protein
VLDESYARDHLGVTPGPHVMLAVTDTGCGFDNATRARIFEPFFTTKETGKGTGLGLSTVFGIVKQSGGSIWVYSEVGHGSTFKVYLPVVTGADAADGPAPQLGRLSAGGDETILLVEDEPQVRQVARQILQRKGYHVLEADGAAEALRISAQHAGEIDLLLTDVIMPKMSGPQLAALLATARPSTAVVYMSGYTDDAIVNHGILEPGIDFVPKPLLPESLATKVREVLDRRGVPRRA